MFGACCFQMNHFRNQVVLEIIVDKILPINNFCSLFIKKVPNEIDKWVKNNFKWVALKESILIIEMFSTLQCV